MNKSEVQKTEKLQVHAFGLLNFQINKLIMLLKALHAVTLKAARITAVTSK